MKQTHPTTIFTDSQSRIQLAKNHVFHARMKHIEVKYHFVREKLQSEGVSVVHCSTTLQLANMFTKSLSKNKFETFRARLGLEAIT
ncbi:hypothetical protein O6H91_20G050600 [Diphasiastrum complanatum]|uniref:Uncharacterized protein n=2 Tax=Diphasiastrum complanatum TaxID=34168 RepID=A0ACC2AQG9_DIPCM|nr:hypothetical protein O6H91_20G006900 [Diphasiastrum complanatum]KAJ7519680.1 hypothetical protein O6H91_20G050600 [Diphasiastrum complanatum]